MSKKIMTVTEIAKKVNRTTDYIRYEIKGGRLSAKKVGPIWIISEGDFNKWQKKRRPRK